MFSKQSEMRVLSTTFTKIRTNKYFYILLLWEKNCHPPLVIQTQWSVNNGEKAEELLLVVHIKCHTFLVPSSAFQRTVASCVFMCVWTAFSGACQKLNGQKWFLSASSIAVNIFFPLSGRPTSNHIWMNERADRKLISWNVKTIAKLNCDKLLTTCFNVRTRVKCAASVSELTLVCHSLVDYYYSFSPLIPLWYVHICKSVLHLISWCMPLNCFNC